MMRHFRIRIVMSVAVALWLTGRHSEAQTTFVGPGSTPQGDFLRGEGVYLQGLGWYELNDAKATAKNAETAKKLYDWNQQIALAYRREYNASVDREFSRRKMNEAARRQFLAERDLRLRTKPTPEDIQKGDALNLLLADLSDPTIQESAWRGSKVALPDDISIKSMVFQFTPKAGAKENAALTKGLIALGRLDMEGRWPDVFPLAKLQAEIMAYEDSYKKIREQSLAGRLDLEAVAELDRSLTALESAVGKVVPKERGFRTTALQYIRELKLAAGMFDATTLPFAREMIADTSQHEAHTVGELLAFMRKYRLKFAPAGIGPNGAEAYSRLYGLLSEQKKSLGLSNGPSGGGDVEQGPSREGAIALEILTRDLDGIVNDRLVAIQGFSSGRGKKEMIGAIIDQVRIAREAIKRDRQVDPVQAERLHKVVKDLRFTLEHSNPELRIGGNNVGLIRSVIDLLERDLNALQK